MGGEGSSATSRRRKRRCLTCCGACCLVLILIVVVLVILAFTFFKAKDPIIHVDSVTLESFKGSIVLNIPPTISLNVTLGLVVSVTNPNKVGFKYTNSTTHMLYRGVEVGLVSIPPGQVSAGGTEQISSILQLMADRLISNSNLYSDFSNGSLPFSTTTDLSGRVDILHIFKHHVDTYSVCNITISVANQSVSNTICTYDVKL